MTSREKVVEGPNIAALAALARIDIDEAEMKKLEAEIPMILSFAAKVQEVAGTAMVDTNPPHKNVMREDGNPHETGLYTEALLSAAPEREKGYVSVVQVLKGGKHI